MITISVQGRFPTLNLAKYFADNDIPVNLLTSYPKFFIRRLGIPTNITVSIREVSIAKKILKILNGYGGNYFNTDWYLNEWFDLRASKLISEDTTLFDGWSQCSLRCIRMAHKLGAKTVVQRGSTHICTQDRLLREEYELNGIPYSPIDKRFVEKELSEYDETDYICIPSNFVKRSFIENGIDERKLITIPYGVSLNTFKRGKKRDNVFRIIQCSNLSLRKGIQYLLPAFHELNLPDAELWLIGSLTPEIEPFIRKYRDPRIVIKGVVPFNALPEYYSQGSVFCLASIEEGMAMVQAQAMACALPVICTTNTGGEDIVRDGYDGFVIPVRSVDALKEKILYFYENQDACIEMGRSAQKRVQSGFTWLDYGDKMYDQYRCIQGHH